MRPRLEEFLRANAAVAPDCVALVDADGCRCTYRELEEVADAIADLLRAVGVRGGDRVGICGSKRIETVAALFGVLKAGAAYVPVDPDAPPSRSAEVFVDCAVRVVLVDSVRCEALERAFTALGCRSRRAASVAGFESLTATSPRSSGDDDLAYILYTSGSTGRPKGVSHTHASALAFVDWCSEAFCPTRADRFSSHAPFHFDLSIFDLYVALKHGATVRLIGADEGKSPRAIADLITAERLTVWYSTPTTLRALVEHAPLAACDHSSLRVVCFAGEVFPMKHLRRLTTIWSQAQFYNLYGPTETNVCAFHRVADPSGLTDDAAVPIGRQCSGDRLRVASPSGLPVTRGTDGELLVSGGSVMRGYWNAAHYDAAAFLMLDGRRWYRTGDIVVEREDGELIFRGRRDRMVKRRGYRIELGEIEATLSCHEHVSQVAAVTRTDWADDVRIVAFYTFVAEEPPTFIELKRYCVSVLPSYMSPDLIQPVSALPHTSTGKVDYRRLEEVADELLAKRQSA